jgi:abortive infection bacteriophage resistance protein
LSKPPYQKSALTHNEQIELLWKRGMIIDDDSITLRTMQHYNYYRLSGYWLAFKIDGDKDDNFKPQTEFSEVLRIYEFDRRLRLIILDAIERIEVSVRAQWSYHIGHIYGAHGYLNDKIFNPNNYQRNMESLTKEIDRADEIFIQHFKEKYSDRYPPIWAVCEIMSLGLLSRWYKSLQPKKIRQSIADIYQIDDTVLQSWLRHLLVIRNICAHHSRLWNRKFSGILPKLPKKNPNLSNAFVSNASLYNSLIVLLHMTQIIPQSSEWSDSLRNLLKQHPDYLKTMGFPDDWSERSIWRS